MKINQIVTENLRTENPCWKGYKAVGTKEKDGRTVPNCVPVKENDENIPDLEEVGEPVESIMDAERRLAHGDRIFAFHEMDEEPFEIFNTGDLKGYAYDQLLAVPNNMAEAANAAQQAAIAVNMKKAHKKPKDVTEGSETAADIDKKIEFHKQGQAAAQYKGSMNKMHAAKIRELQAKKETLKKQGVAEGEQYSSTFYDPKYDTPDRSDQAAADFKRIMAKHNVKSREDAEQNREFQQEILNKHAKQYGGTYQVDNHFGWSDKLAGKSGPHWHKQGVAEGADDIHSARVGDEIALKNPSYRGIIAKIDGDNISFKNDSDGKRYKATMKMIDRNLSQEQRYKEKSAKDNKGFDDAMARDMARIHKSGALEKFGIGVKEDESKLHKHHQELRKKSGLPHPDEYLKMIEKKKAEIAALKAEIEADKKKVATEDTFNLAEELRKLDEKSAAWQRKAGKNKNGGLNRKGVKSYRREHPGSKLQTAVTTKPSKLKPGSKSAKRRKSFCARMSGVKGPMKDKHGKPTRKALALRKWNC